MFSNTACKVKTPIKKTIPVVKEIDRGAIIHGQKPRSYADSITLSILEKKEYIAYFLALKTRTQPNQEFVDSLYNLGFVPDITEFSELRKKYALENGFK